MTIVLSRTLCFSSCRLSCSLSSLRAHCCMANFLCSCCPPVNQYQLYCCPALILLLPTSCVFDSSKGSRTSSCGVKPNNQNRMNDTTSDNSRKRFAFSQMKECALPRNTRMREKVGRREPKQEFKTQGPSDKEDGEYLPEEKKKLRRNDD